MIIGIFDKTSGVIYSGSLKQLGIQVLGLCAIGLWGGLLAGCFFFMMKKIDRLKVGKVYEVLGLDVLMH